MDFRSEKFQLLRRFVFWRGACAIEQFHSSELLVGDAQYANLSFRWQDRLHASCVDIGLLGTFAITYVDGKLKHAKAVV